MPKRQGLDQFGLNVQIGRDDNVEIQKNFYVVILIETAANGGVFDDFAIHCDDNLPRYNCLELRSRLCELGLRHNPVVILVEFGDLRGVPDRKRQCCLKAVHALSDREAAQPGIVTLRVLKWQQQKQKRKNRALNSARPGQARRRCLAVIPRVHKRMTDRDALGPYGWE